MLPKLDVDTKNQQNTVCTYQHSKFQAKASFARAVRVDEASFVQTGKKMRQMQT
jgi:hypothetical protein